MNRRLYFLLPDREHALTVVEELNIGGISSDRIHTIGNRHTRLNGLPTATLRQASDAARRLEKILWNANLLSFMVALCMFIALLFTLAWTWWLTVPITIMVANFLVSLTFSSVPSTHLGEFRDALTPGEILLIVDVAETKVAQIGNHVHHRHPEVAIGGIGWGNAALG